MESLLEKRHAFIQKRAKRSGPKKPPTWLLEVIMADSNRNSIPEKSLDNDLKDIGLPEPRYFDHDYNSDDTYSASKSSDVRSQDDSVFPIFPYSASHMFIPSSQRPKALGSSFYDSIHPASYNFGEIISSEKRNRLYFSPLENRFKSRFRRPNIKKNNDDSNQRQKILSLAALLGDRYADEMYLSSFDRPSRYFNRNWNGDD